MTNGNLQKTPTSTIPIRALNDDEKPREKALRGGMDSLSDVELLALLLGSGVPGKSVLDLSREILQDCDNRLRVLARMSIAELKKKYKGVGDAKATLLVAAMAFGSRVQTSLDCQDPQMTCSRDVHTYMRSRLERLNYEEFWVLHQPCEPGGICRPGEQRGTVKHLGRYKTDCKNCNRPSVVGYNTRP